MSYVHANPTLNFGGGIVWFQACMVSIVYSAGPGVSWQDQWLTIRIMADSLCRRSLGSNTFELSRLALEEGHVFIQVTGLMKYRPMDPNTA